MGNSKVISEAISWAIADDCDALVPLMMALYQHDVPEADEPTLNEVKAHLALLTAPTTPHRLAVAWKEENVAVGLAAVAIFVSISDPRSDRWHQAELKELFVLPDFRGERIGEALLECIIHDKAACSATSDRRRIQNRYGGESIVDAAAYSPTLLSFASERRFESPLSLM